MNLLYYFYWIYCIAAATIITFVSFYFVHKLQEEGYDLRRFTAWLKARFFQDSLILILFGVIGLMLKICNIFFINKIPVLAYICFYGADVLFLYLLYSMYAAYKKEEHAQKLVVKGPALRIFILIWIIAFLCEANMMRETQYYISVTWLTYLTPYFIGYLPCMVLPLLVIVAYCITSPHLAFRRASEGDTFYMQDDAGDADTLQAPGDLDKIDANQVDDEKGENEE